MQGGRSRLWLVLAIHSVLLLSHAGSVANGGHQNELLYKATDLISDYLKEYSVRKSKVLEFKHPAELRLDSQVRCGHSHRLAHRERPYTPHTMHSGALHKPTRKHPSHNKCPNTQIHRHLVSPQSIPFRKLIDFTLGEDGIDDDAILALVKKAVKYSIHTGVCLCLLLWTVASLCAVPQYNCMHIDYHLVTRMASKL